eukprot:CAMPEP_0204035040 /NCGR_PEP_ID=MMETSP0360-20130528/74764_1 /ASSEMBLY_ACC=CAM_ASM_000342 /TAXON_ID=268821 /ORGANISM="Scrippsiella Hangoei, Strain SHTV-5" /LENGTH=53 /DNA_ID=CAMNT_0050979971 /DNA_START=34 /DNA_END=192 /DNA_ORIENTATION=+
MTAARWIPDATIALTISGFLLMTSQIEACRTSCENIGDSPGTASVLNVWNECC